MTKQPDESLEPPEAQIRPSFSVKRTLGPSRDLGPQDHDPHVDMGSYYIEMFIMALFVGPPILLILYSLFTR